MMNHQDLVHEAELRLNPLRAHHAASLKCRRGCSSCCTDITVLPVEWYAIELAIGRDAFESRNDDPEKCPFVARNGACGIYGVRPLICRIHGLPLSYPLEEYDNQGKRIMLDPPNRHVLWCDLNFLGVDKFEPDFSEDDVFDMVWFHQELEILNERFLRSEVGGTYGTGEVLSLRDQVNLRPL
jgi:uncharacterized protein